MIMSFDEVEDKLPSMFMWQMGTHKSFKRSLTGGSVSIVGGAGGSATGDSARLNSAF